MIEVDVKTLHGHLFTCNKCNKFHFEFNQIGIDFSSFEVIKNFHKYLEEVDGKQFESLNKETNYRRKIHIPFPKTAIKFTLDHTDLMELIILLSTFIEEYSEELKAQIFIRQLSEIKIGQLN